jgi:hypothetical protein
MNARYQKVYSESSFWSKCSSALKKAGHEVLDSDVTQHQVVMVPATGELLVAVPPREVVELEIDGGSIGGRPAGSRRAGRLGADT